MTPNPRAWGLGALLVASVTCFSTTPRSADEALKRVREAYRDRGVDGGAILEPGIGIGIQTESAEEMADGEYVVSLEPVDPERRVAPDVKVVAAHIILIWNTQADLDLHMNEPDGTMRTYEKPVGTGTMLLLDAIPMHEDDTLNQVEDMYITTEAAPGEYVIDVHNYNGHGSPTKFAVYALNYDESGKDLMLGSYDSGVAHSEGAAQSPGISHDEKRTVLKITITQDGGVEVKNIAGGGAVVDNNVVVVDDGELVEGTVLEAVQR